MADYTYTCPYCGYVQHASVPAFLMVCPACGRAHPRYVPALAREKRARSHYMFGGGAASGVSVGSPARIATSSQSLSEFTVADTFAFASSGALVGLIIGMLTPRAHTRVYRKFGSRGETTYDDITRWETGMAGAEAGAISGLISAWTAPSNRTLGQDAANKMNAALLAAACAYLAARHASGARGVAESVLPIKGKGSFEKE